jgi:hypothetical protein
MVTNHGPSRAQPTVEPLESRALLSITVRIDYSLDSSNFFADPARRAIMQQAADALDSRLADTLSAIVPGGTNSWSLNLNHPATGATHTFNNPTIPADTVVVYVGSRELGTTLGQGGPNGWGASGNQAWFDLLRGRGEPGALTSPPTDFAPAAGAITFDSTSNWFFGSTTAGLTSGQNDFLSVAMHELGHVLGYGTADSWNGLVAPGGTTGLVFTGPVARAANGGVNPGLANNAHWADGLRSDGRQPAMSPALVVGTRKNFTTLDFAGLDDTGWDLTAPPPPADNASVAGMAFNDVDADGVRDAGEATLANVRVYADADKDGVFDSTEKSALTDAAGNYKITGLAAGSHRVRQVLPAGFRVSSPAAGYHTVTLTAGQAVTARNFADTQKALISGTAFNDLNGNARRDAGEPALASRRVFLDADKDGIFDSTERSMLTDAAGNYAFKDLTAGTYRVREVLPAGWRRTAPASNFYDLTLASGGSATGRSFGSTQKVLLAGSVFNDANGDRVKQSTETGLANWRVYIDADNDGVFDAGERSLLTDTAGNWRFTDLAAGTFVLRVVQQAGFTRTTPTTGAPAGSFTVTLTSGGSKAGLLFGQRRTA